MYADDLVIFSLSASGLQNKLNILYEYCQKWELTVNAKKTEVMVISSKDYTSPIETMKFGGIVLKWVTTYKYLGILIQSNGKMTNAMENLCARGWKAMFKMKTAFKNIEVNPATNLQFFDILVKPIVCYASEVWGGLNNFSKCKSKEDFWKLTGQLPAENFQVKFCKNLLGVHPKACNNAVMGELGRYPMFLFIIRSMLNFHKHMVDVANTRPLLTATLSEDKLLPNNKSWFHSLTKILSLFDINFSEYTNLCHERLMQNITGRMKTSYTELWKKSLGPCDDNSGKLHLFRKIKTNFSFETYLSVPIKRKYRRALTAFRISAHKLEIETGRHANKKSNTQFTRREERFCKLCMNNNIKIIGDEYHALLVCPTFEKKRASLLQMVEQRVPNFQCLNNYYKTIYLLTSEDKDMVVQLSKFLFDVLSIQRLVKKKQV